MYNHHSVKDPLLIEERLLELKLIVKDLLCQINDNNKAEKEWRDKTKKIDLHLEGLREKLETLPKGHVASLVDSNASLLELKKRESGMKKEIEEVKRNIKRQQIEQEKEKEELYNDLEQMHSLVVKGKSEVSYWHQMYESLQSCQIEPLLREKQELQQKLKKIVGLDELLRIIFNKFDADGSGSLGLNEVEKALESVLGEGKVSRRDINSFLSLNDTNSDGKIDATEFIKAYKYLMTL
jgi:Ca2+-binding EF-hand superfamily protein